jgi:hypothetical protein
MEIDVPVGVAYNLYSDRQSIPRWMPFISSVQVCNNFDASLFHLESRIFILVYNDLDKILICLERVIAINVCIKDKLVFDSI